MIRTTIFLALSLLAISLPAFAQDKPRKIVIIKADDVRGITTKWNRFFSLSKKKGVKVSAGIICDSLEGDKKDYFKWLNELNASGAVEFWNHGWDHKRWTTGNSSRISEFGGSGYEHQKKHFEDAQNVMKKVLGVAPVAFGTPYNAVDADTVKVMNENADMRLFFCYRAKDLDNKVLAPMRLRGESNGTGKPDFEKFKAQYTKQDPSFTAIQFHPNAFSDAHFAEYAKILDFLIAEGWTFMQPSEYVAILNEAKKKH